MVCWKREEVMADHVKKSVAWIALVVLGIGCMIKSIDNLENTAGTSQFSWYNVIMFHPPSTTVICVFSSLVTSLSCFPI